MTFKELRIMSGMNMTQYASFFNIPYRTIQDWEYEKRKCPDYVTELMQYKLENEGKIKTETRA
jgi:DNA-binding transcriptional regulator YiaG